MPNNKYDHNVDIKSTQLANGLKGIGVGALSLLFAGVVLFLGGSTVLIIQGIYENNQDKKERKQAISITSFSTMNEILDDYRNNEARYDIKWRDKYVTHIGKVTDIDSYSFDMSTQTSRVEKVICNWDYDEKERVAQLNTGDTISVTGKLTFQQWNLKINSCEIP